MKRILILGVFLLFYSCLWAHDGATPVIIDTDAAIDDLRAITLLLANDHVEVLSITVSEGACSVSTGCVKVKNLLRELGMERIPVGAGNRTDIKTPDWREFSEGIRWGDDPVAVAEEESAAVVVQRALSRNEDDFVYIALGSFNTLAHLIKNDTVQEEQITAVIWYNDSATPLSGSNYSYDPEAAKNILNSSISVKIFGDGNSAPLITDEMLSSTEEYLNSFAAAIFKSHASESVQSRIRERHLRGWDDQVAIWFQAPEIFACRGLDKYKSVTFCSLMDKDGFYRAFREILEQAGGRRKRVVLREFPIKPTQYTDDLAPLVESIIERHGEEEFRLIVMTNELHRHLGIYSIVGAKMGLCARDILGAGMDGLTVKTFCGLQPPLSCLNDGIQVSTGATLGQGLIEVTEEKRVAAEFRKGDDLLILELKTQYVAQIRSDIQRLIADYGKLTPTYWQQVRKLALRYWHDWDRNEIFSSVKRLSVK